MTAFTTSSFREAAISTRQETENQSVAEQMLTLTRSEPETFKIRDHKQEIKQELLSEVN